MNPSLLGEVNTKPESLPRRERDNLRQRREILHAALGLFSEKGYHNVSMHEIAGKAEFGIGTLYKFFSNKESLYKALIMEMAEAWHRVLVGALERERNPLQAIKRYIAVRRRLFLENLPLVRLYFAETRGASVNVRAGLDQDLLRLYDDRIERLASVFEKGINDHVLRSIEPHHMALALDGILNAFLFRMMEDPARCGTGDDLSTAADIFFRGVLTK